MRWPAVSLGEPLEQDQISGAAHRFGRPYAVGMAAPIEARAGWKGGAIGLATLLLVIAPALAFLSGVLDGQFVSNADYLYPFEVVPDLLGDGEVGNWNVPFSSYVFPDWILTAAAVAPGTSTVYALALFSVLQVALAYVACRGMAMVFSHDQVSIRAMLSLSLPVGLCVAGVAPFAFLGTAYTHTGTAIMALLALALAVQEVVDPRRHDRLLLLSVIMFALAASDDIVLVWFVLPLAATLAVLAAIRAVPIGSSARCVAVLAVATIGGNALDRRLFPRRSDYTPVISFDSLRAGFSRAVASAQPAFDGAPWATPLYLLGFAFLVGCGAVALFSPASRDRSSVLVLTVFFAASSAATAIAHAALQDTIAAGPRYWLFPFLLLAVAPVAIASSYSRGRSKDIVVVLGVVVSGSALVFAAVNLPKVSGDRSGFDTACIDSALERGDAQYGMAPYWDARPIELFTAQERNVAIIGPSLQIWPLNSDVSDATMEYDFIASSPKPGNWNYPYAIVEALSGPPNEIVTCGDVTLLIWAPSGVKTAFDPPLGGTIVLPPCVLGVLSGADADCESTVSVEGPQSIAMGSPLIVARGAYQITASYRASSNDSTLAGTWTVASTYDTSSEVTASLLGTEGLVHTSTALVVISESDFGPLRMSFQAEDGQTIDIAEIEITKLADG